jgi:hypothetical protein
VKGYGGAMGGGKSRALCEDVFQDMLEHPGVVIPIFRLRHVSIFETTKRTMLTEVIRRSFCATVIEGERGSDFMRCRTAVRCIRRLDDPVRWFPSSLAGRLRQAHEIPEDSVLKLMTRLRQRGMSHPGAFVLQPENPGHWLYRWFIAGAERVDLEDGSLLGYRKEELFPSDASRSVGDCEFVFAPPDSNVYLPEGYVENTLGGLPDLLRRRYMDGEWLFVSGLSYFEPEALAHYATMCARPVRRFDFVPVSGGGKAQVREWLPGQDPRLCRGVGGMATHQRRLRFRATAGTGRLPMLDLGTMEPVCGVLRQVGRRSLCCPAAFSGAHVLTALIGWSRVGVRRPCCHRSARWQG